MTSTDPVGEGASGAGAAREGAAREGASGAGACDRPATPAGDATSGPVRSAMVTRPKTLPLAASAGEARRLFTNPKVLSAVLLEGSRYAGLLDREAVGEAVLDEAPIRPFARRDVPVVTAGRALIEAEEIMSRHGVLRLPVVEEDGKTLAGLLCLNHERDGFCHG